MNKKRKLEYDELFNKAGTTPETFTTIELEKEVEGVPSTEAPPKPFRHKELPTPQRLTNIPERIIKRGG
jgi:hypothetical protein